MKKHVFTLAATFAAALVTPLLAQSASSCPDHHAGVESRGDHVMGFDHEKTTHHFRLTPAGGVIEVTARSESDTASRDAIRKHLAHIAQMFAAGDFEAPMLIHEQVPPGVPVMKQKAEAITWTLCRPAGGRRSPHRDRRSGSPVGDPRVSAIQIEDHQTGDPTDASKSDPRE